MLPLIFTQCIRCFFPSRRNISAADQRGEANCRTGVQNLLVLQERSRASGKGPLGEARCLISRPSLQCLGSRPPPLPFSRPTIPISPCRRNPLRWKHASAINRATAIVLQVRIGNFHCQLKRGRKFYEPLCVCVC